MRKYDVGYILKPNLESADIKKVIDSFNNIFSSYDSKVIELKETGLKDLAYEIDHFKKGYYVWLVVEAAPEAVKEWNRVVRLTENVIRYIIVDKEGN
ncbi:MAG: 30S ribosomal protein S6 [Acholeplasmatales bacterium]|jgi:small subunit ribosomal protein S6|nr:30S ribosomal protein S6 [Acholeplasmatales bacterium]